jgi:hypothetical protein
MRTLQYSFQFLSLIIGILWITAFWGFIKDWSFKMTSDFQLVMGILVTVFLFFLGEWFGMYSYPVPTNEYARWAYKEKKKNLKTALFLIIVAMLLFCGMMLNKN